jgi:acylphosphatase
MIARRVRVNGRVQGVFFRAWTRDEARSLRVAGWVRNCSDGSVEAHIEGDEDAVDELIRRMRHGPPHAKVVDFEVSDAAPEGLQRFEVRD